MHPKRNIPLTVLYYAVTALQIVIFGASCWDRDWLLYPNYNYVSWSFAFALFSCACHICAALLMYKVREMGNVYSRAILNKFSIVGSGSA